MLATERQTRFAESCTDAALGYAVAATAAYGALASQAFEFWKMALPFAAEPEPRSWYRHPDAPKRADGLFVLQPWMPLAAWQPRATQLALPLRPGPGDQFAALINAWLAAPAILFDFWSMRRAPVSWPLAFLMISAGWPRAVAVPAAEANAAVLDAASLAGEALQNAYARYRSDGGHASTHIVYARERTSGTAAHGLAAFAVAPMAWPWLFDGASRAVA